MAQCISPSVSPVSSGSQVRDSTRCRRAPAFLSCVHWQGRVRGSTVPPVPRRRPGKRGSSESFVVGSGETEAGESPAPVFHLAFPVRDLDEAKAFYGEKLNLLEGRSAATWVDYSLFGHQIVCHEIKGYSASASANAVDGDPVPVPHMGLAMSKAQFDELADKVRNAGIPFVIEPHLRFAGQPGEQWTMFFKDPSGNALEFKAMSHPENLFARYYVE
mmetsp:Transcript_38190/g.68491  ORF Transcript_38190/g.68491 Transcript_38190/m.68491 type:complete len:217 (-) Transcript_38190:136-786(-)